MANGLISESDSEPDVRHRIVVGVDGSENANKALEWAAIQADSTGAVLEIHTTYEPGYVHVTKEEVQRAMKRIVGKALDDVAKLGFGGFKGLLLGSVSQKCSLHAQCPVAIIR
jgi:nucleotide-binding universal stress UspA family protein